MKRSRVCLVEKTLDEFYKSKSGKYGQTAACRQCTIKGVKKYRQTPAGKESVRRYNDSPHGRANNRRHRRSPKGKATLRRCGKRDRKEQPHKMKARHAISNAIRSGQLLTASTQKCKQCGNQANQYHHHLGYDNKHWLDVIPLCYRCHSASEPK